MNIWFHCFCFEFLWFTFKTFVFIYIIIILHVFHLHCIFIHSNVKRRVTIKIPCQCYIVMSILYNTTTVTVLRGITDLQVCVEPLLSHARCVVSPLLWWRHSLTVHVAEAEITVWTNVEVIHGSVLIATLTSQV